jgi:hypothetical protein
MYIYIYMQEVMTSAVEGKLNPKEYVWINEQTQQEGVALIFSLSLSLTFSPLSLFSSPLPLAPMHLEIRMAPQLG